MSKRIVSNEVWLRHMMRGEVAEVAAIEATTFPDDPLSEADIMVYLRDRTAVAAVAERDGKPVAYVLYEIVGKTLNIYRLAVAHKAQRQGIGRQIISILANRTSKKRPVTLSVLVPEINMGAIRFFAACGFRATGVERRAFVDCDGYRMER